MGSGQKRPNLSRRLDGFGRVRLFLAGLGASLVLGGLGYAAIPRRASDIEIGLLPLQFIFLAVSLVPFFLYLKFVSTRAGSLLIGLALVAATVWIYVLTFLSLSDSSTAAALGFLDSMLLNYGITLGGIVVDFIVRRHSGGRGIPSRPSTRNP